MIRPTPQQGIAAGLVLLALILTLGRILAGPGSYPVSARELRFGTRDLVVWPSEQALGPVVPTAAGERALNPFSLRYESTLHRVKIGVPPPPTLDLPELPPLPLDPGRP